MKHELEPGFYVQQSVCRVVDGREQRPEHEAFVYPNGTTFDSPGLLPSYKARTEAEAAMRAVCSENPGLYEHREGDISLRTIRVISLCSHTIEIMRKVL